MKRRNVLLALSVCALATFAGAVVAWRDTSIEAAGPVTSITSLDTADNVGLDTSIAMDASGNPVVSYHDFTNGDLKVLHCVDPNCASGNETVASPDTAGNVGRYTSLVLDESGNPVVSYYHISSFSLKLLHCNDPNCAPGSESITSPDTGGVGPYTSLELDGSGYPVVSYYDLVNGDLKVLHCDDANCAAGGDRITSPDTAGDAGQYISLSIDSSRNPVVSYYDVTNANLKVVHCDDQNCDGGGESMTSPDTAGIVGLSTSLMLDATDNPIIAYIDDSNGELKVMHCNDTNCTGANESITAPDGAFSEQSPSLALDGSGNPVIAYYNPSNQDLKVVHCDDANCSAGGESIVFVDTAGGVGTFAALALDASGNPVVSYRDATNQDLKVLHCNDNNCAPADDSIASPDRGGDVGYYTSLALDPAGNPVISHLDLTNDTLEVIHCNDPSCVGSNEAFSALFATNGFLAGQSLVLDPFGQPIIAYVDGALRLLRCNDVNCIGGDDIPTSPDALGGTVGDPSLVLDTSGFPVIAVRGFTVAVGLKIIHCDDVNCSGGPESTKIPDGGAYPSLRLDASGFPVVSYQSSPGLSRDLKILHCNDPNCDGIGESITTPDSSGDTGYDTSLELDGLGNPIVTYKNATTGEIRLLHCDDPNCSGGGEAINVLDTREPLEGQPAARARCVGISCRCVQHDFGRSSTKPYRRALQ